MMYGKGAATGLMLVSLGVLGWMPTALAAGDANAAKGLIADQCAKCHETPYTRPEQRSAAVDAPSFQAMANDAAKYSPDKLRVSLLQPHFPMQQFTLSTSDIENILAFIATLKR